MCHAYRLGNALDHVSQVRRAMKREIYDEDHAAFRDSVREFLNRSVLPNAERHAAEKALPREFWTEAGKQGFLGLHIPEEYGGAGTDDYRFTAVLGEELSKAYAALWTWLPLFKRLDTDGANTIPTIVIANHSSPTVIRCRVTHLLSASITCSR